MFDADPSQWFEGLGTCRCGKAATGILRGVQNQSMGPYCERCANGRIKKAQDERAKARTRRAAVELQNSKARDSGCVSKPDKHDLIMLAVTIVVAWLFNDPASPIYPGQFQ